MSRHAKDQETAASSVIASVLYRPGQAPLDVAVDQVDTLAAASGHLLWIGLHEPPAELLAELGEKLGFSARAIEEITQLHRRPKIIEFTRFTLVVAITFTVHKMRPVFGELQILIGQGFLITIRRNTPESHRSLRQQLESSPELLDRGSDFVASALLDWLADCYMAALARFESGVEGVEEKFLLQGLTPPDIRGLYRQRRDLLRIHNAIAPLAEICRRLSRVEMGQIDANCRGYFAEAADRLIRLDELTNSLREALAFAFEAGLMIGQSQQTDITKKLAAWAAILAVPTAIAGIYGMNFKHMPELDWTYGYGLVLGVTGLICVLLYRRFRKSGWL